MKQSAHKKIGIITFHASHNCGSMLQAYALQSTLTRLGYTNEIINFSNAGSREMYSVLPKIHLFRRGIRGRISSWFKSLGYYSLLKRQSEFYVSFLSQYLHLTEKEYRSDEELKNEPFDFTHYVTGSDQVWNICCKDADTAYYLDFVKEGKKIALAVSTGATILKKVAKDISIYEKLIESFDAISVRERNSVKQFQELSGRNDIELLIDPTLLFTQKDWESHFDLSKPIVQGDYIFYYAFHYSHEVNAIVKQIAQKLHIPVIIIDARAWGVNNCKKDGLTLCEKSGPIAFLNLMKYAKIVLTTSFHGTVFSVIFRRIFWFIDSTMHNECDDRASTLLDQLSLTDRMIDGKALLQRDFCSRPDFSGIEERINQLQDKEISFLEETLK